MKSSNGISMIIRGIAWSALINICTSCRDASSDSPNPSIASKESVSGVSFEDSSDLNFTRIEYAPIQSMQISRGRKVNITYSFEDHQPRHSLPIFSLDTSGKYVTMFSQVELPLFEGGSFVGIAPDTVRAAVKESLQKISAVTPLCFIEIQGPAMKPDIVIRKSIGNQGGALGIATGDYVRLSPMSVSASVPVLLHEFMHSIGIGHTTVRGSVMTPIYSGVSTLSADDIAALQAEYGAGSCESTVSTDSKPYDFLKPIIVEQGNSFATLQWSGVFDKGSGYSQHPDEYKIELSTGNEELKEYRRVPGQGDLTAKLTGLRPNTEYRARVSTSLKYVHTAISQCYSSEDTSRPIPYLGFCGIVRKGESAIIYKRKIPGIYFDIYKRGPGTSPPVKIATMTDSESEFSVNLQSEFIYMSQAYSAPKEITSKEITFKTSSAAESSWKPIQKNNYQDLSQITILETANTNYVVGAVNSPSEAKIVLGSTTGTIDINSSASGVETFSDENIISLLSINSKVHGPILLATSNSLDSCSFRIFTIDSAPSLKLIWTSKRESGCTTPKLSKFSETLSTLSWTERKSAKVYWIWDINSHDFKVEPTISTHMTTKFQDGTVKTIGQVFSYQDDAYFLTTSEITAEKQFRLVRTGFKKPGDRLYPAYERILIQNRQSAYHIASSYLKDGKESTLFTSDSVKGRLGIIHINWFDSAAKPTYLTTYKHDVSELSVEAKFAEQLTNGSILGVLPDKLQIYDQKGAIKISYPIPAAIKSLHDWVPSQDGIYILGKDDAAQTTFCHLGTTSKCSPLANLLPSYELLGRARILSDSKSNIYLVATVLQGSKQLVLTTKGVIP